MQCKYILSTVKELTPRLSMQQLRNSHPILQTFTKFPFHTVKSRTTVNRSLCSSIATLNQLKNRISRLPTNWGTYGFNVQSSVVTF